MRTFKLKFAIIGLALFMGIVGLAAEANAQPKPNVFDGGDRWLITYYDDCDAVHTQWATQGICFLPYKPCGACGIRGVWYSDTFGPGWRGGYMQEGDRLLMHGNWDWPSKKFVGSDGMVIDLFGGTSPRDEGAGQWTEWFNNPAFGTPDFYGNARLRRVGKCHLPQGVDLSRMSEAEVERLSVDLSSKVKPRMRRDGKVAESPTDPEQVPLREEKEYQR
jgi:hypothetical protein